MPDPIEDLEHFIDQGLNVNPLPAAEVRRRGTRMRRRNNVVAAVAGVAAVALVAVPLGLYAAGGDGRAAEPAPINPGPSRTTDASATGWLQEVPAGFPLAEGLPATNGLDGSPVTVIDEPALAVITLCGVPAWSATSAEPVEPADAAGATYTGESEDSAARTLAVYENEHAAEQAVAGLRTALDNCPVDRTGTRAPQRYDVSPADLGEESFTFTQRSLDGAGFLGDLGVYQVVRVGNAVYLAASYGQGGGDEEVIAHTRQLMNAASAGVISDLCLFAAEPCGPADGDPGEASGSGSP
jgi:hypothetical protein